MASSTSPNTISLIRARHASQDERDLERRVRQALRDHRTRTAAAEALGIDRSTLYRYLERFGLEQWPTPR